MTYVKIYFIPVKRSILIEIATISSQQVLDELPLRYSSTKTALRCKKTHLKNNINKQIFTGELPKWVVKTFIYKRYIFHCFFKRMHTGQERHTHKKKRLLFRMKISSFILSKSPRCWTEQGPLDTDS